jgi:hypothetical protein
MASIDWLTVYLRTRAAWTTPEISWKISFRLEIGDPVSEVFETGCVVVITHFSGKITYWCSKTKGQVSECFHVKNADFCHDLKFVGRSPLAIVHYLSDL